MEEKRTSTENDWCGNEGTTKCEESDWHFANEVYTVRVSDSS